MTHALIVADGDVPTRQTVDRLVGATRIELVVAADGGALKAESLGLPAQVVVGDADSLPREEIDRLRSAGAEVIVHPAAKDQSDTELAVGEALRRGAQSLLLIGAFGGRRIEHTLANILLLGSPELAGLDVRAADDTSVLRVMTGPARLELHGRVGDFVSLLPLSDRVSGVSTDDLAYPLSDAVLVQGPARGLSNELMAPSATISLLAGRLAVVHTTRGVDPT